MVENTPLNKILLSFKTDNDLNSLRMECGGLENWVEVGLQRRTNTIRD
ncbi:MAG: hypothetical protein ACXWV9_04565 [Flavisolibacter sp.]